MPMARKEESFDILHEFALIAIDIRKDWPDILETILNNQTIQNSMEKSYQDFQEGFRLKDFKHKNGVKGIWSFTDINNGIYPYTLTTTDWIIEYEEKEWKNQATKNELKLKNTIQNAIQQSIDIDHNNII